MKHTVSDRKFGLPVCICVYVLSMFACVCVCVCAAQTFASTASCRRKQFSQLLKRCPKLSRHQRMFLYQCLCSILPLSTGIHFFVRPRYFRRGHETRLVSGAAPDWLRRLSRQICRVWVWTKSVTGSRLSHRLFTERRFCHSRVCGSKRSLLELSPRLTVLQASWPTHESF